jgi:hypothetical protein
MSESIPLPTFASDERVCGNCKLWSANQVDPAKGWVGLCRLQVSRGMFPPSAPVCDKFAPRGGVTAFVKPPTPTRTARPPLRSVAPVIRRDGNELVDLTGDLSMTRQELMELFREAAGETTPPPMANKWEGGMIRLVPGNSELQAKDLPIDTLFHKVVMVRDRLRTLEQKLNANPKLTDAEKVELQHYITRVYGSLTSFNLLFREKQDQFIGAKGEGE